MTEPSLADTIRSQKVPCAEHLAVLPKPSCWQCARNGAFERAARMAADFDAQVAALLAYGGGSERGA